MTDAEALKIIVDRRGRMYDLLVVDAFLTLYPTLRLEDPPTNEPHIRNDHALPTAALRARA